MLPLTANSERHPCCWSVDWRSCSTPTSAPGVLGHTEEVQDVGPCASSRCPCVSRCARLRMGAQHRPCSRLVGTFLPSVGVKVLVERLQDVCPHSGSSGCQEHGASSAQESRELAPRPLRAAPRDRCRRRGSRASRSSYLTSAVSFIVFHKASVGNRSENLKQSPPQAFRAALAPMLLAMGGAGSRAPTRAQRWGGRRARCPPRGAGGAACCEEEERWLGGREGIWGQWSKGRQPGRGSGNGGSLEESRCRGSRKGGLGHTGRALGATR